MRAAIVRLSVLTKYNNWSPHFYFGEEIKAEEIAAKEKRIRAQQQTVRKLKKDRRNDKARQRKMVEKGEVTRIG